MNSPASTASLLRNFWICLLMSMACATAQTQPASEPRAESLDAAFRLVRDAVNRGEVPGAIALVARDGRILRHEAFGLSDIENQLPFTTNTLCWIASITKPITVAAAMTLVDAGKLGLDDPVEKYLPEFREQSDTNGAHHSFTIRHLMSHMSGLVPNPPSRRSAWPIGGPLDDSWLEQKLPDIVQTIARSRLRFTPGSKFEYSNSALFVLGRVIEVVSGKPYAAYVKEKILEPLGMTDTHYAPPPHDSNRVAVIYAQRDGKRETIFRFNPTVKISNTAPDGGLFSCPAQLAPFLQMFLDNDGKVLSRRAVAEMLTPQPHGWGLGWSLADDVFLHEGSSGTLAWADRNTGVIGILFLQYRDQSKADERLRKEFRDGVRAAFSDTKRASLRERGSARVEVTRPKRFPHRIWAACDFESRTPDYGWFGPPETNNFPRYPGNATAMGVGARPYQNFSAIMTGINPVPGPRMGKANHLYLRYFLTGDAEATFQHFSLTSNDNNHLRMSGLSEGKWSEVVMNFSRDALRNDGTPGVPFKDGERMDDLKIFIGKPGDGKRHDLVIDDVIFFANDPDLPDEPEPFPNRVIFLAAFDTGPKEKYWPGDFEIAEKDLPTNSYWRVARAVPQKNGKGKWIRLQLDPVRTVGALTKLRFRYYLAGSKRMTVQIFDATDMDNRHINLRDLKTNQWQTLYLDFTKDARRNDGRPTPFAAGHKVDDLFFFVQPDGGEAVDLLIDEVVLFDAQNSN